MNPWPRVNEISTRTRCFVTFSHVLNSLAKALRDRAVLSAGEIESAVEALTQESIPVGEKIEFLVALTEKGETPFYTSE